VYRTEITELLPSEIPGQVADAARDTLGGALAIAQTLPGDLGAALVAVAQTAFVDALHFVAAIAAILAAATAIIVSAALWKVPARSEPQSEEGPGSTAVVATE
jgi:MFS transporter, DHA2 family, multidrug resistance protein